MVRLDEIAGTKVVKFPRGSTKPGTEVVRAGLGPSTRRLDKVQPSRGEEPGRTRHGSPRAPGQPTCPPSIPPPARSCVTQTFVFPPSTPSPSLGLRGAGRRRQEAMNEGKGSKRRGAGRSIYARTMDGNEMSSKGRSHAPMLLGLLMNNV